MTEQGRAFSTQQPADIIQPQALKMLQQMRLHILVKGVSGVKRRRDFSISHPYEFSSAMDWR